MDIDELIKRASPPCHECGAPVLRTEIPWKIQGQDWVPGIAHMVCVNGCRVVVELF